MKHIRKFNEDIESMNKESKIKNNLKIGYDSINDYLLLKNLPKIDTFSFRDIISAHGYSLEYNIYPLIYKNLKYIKEYINSDMNSDNLREKLTKLGYCESTVNHYIKILGEKEVTLTSEKLTEIFVTNVDKVNDIYKLISKLSSIDKENLMSKIMEDRFKSNID